MLHNTLDEPVIVTVTGPYRGEDRQSELTYQPSERIQMQTAGPGELFRFQPRQQQVTIRGMIYADQVVFCYASNWADLHEMSRTNKVLTIQRGDVQC